MVLAHRIAGNHTLDNGVLLNHTGEQRPLIHVVKTWAQLEGANQVLDDLDVGHLNELRQEFLVFEDKIAQAIALPFIELVTLNGSEHGPKHFRSEDIRKKIGSFLSEPEQEFASSFMTADQACKSIFEKLSTVFLQQKSGTLTNQLGTHSIGSHPTQQPDHLVRPILEISFERFKRAAVFSCRNFIKKVGQLRRF